MLIFDDEFMADHPISTAGSIIEAYRREDDGEKISTSAKKSIIPSLRFNGVEGFQDLLGKDPWIQGNHF